MDKCIPAVQGILIHLARRPIMAFFDQANREKENF